MGKHPLPPIRSLPNPTPGFKPLGNSDQGKSERYYEVLHHLLRVGNKVQDTESDTPPMPPTPPMSPIKPPTKRPDCRYKPPLKSKFKAGKSTLDEKKKAL